MNKTIAQLKRNQKANIIALVDHPLRSKLLEMGLMEGKEIELLFKAPLGDPMAIRVNDYVLSMRKEEAKLVEIEILSK